MPCAQRRGENRIAIHSNFLRGWGLSGVKGLTEAKDEIPYAVRLYFDTKLMRVIFCMLSTHRREQRSY